ncbi:hypothetical protein LZ009_03600 [Ramlibacter sp. XY19]|uniref:hypothetical protein n=1 Tax=Ramlibacter paludis TaxID=2908000 RepID=UPI0023DB4423|nr:hypothetical protein [Ramlibacter paludis]MCG2591856.1 hypothetical protein [Ramlibacter paludis]
MDNTEQPRAEHGPQSEVTWDDGKGRQPYANQGKEETTSGSLPDVEGGDRGNASGRNLDQLEQVEGRPEGERR